MSVASPIVSTRTGQTHDARTHDDSTRHAHAHRHTARVRGLPGSVIRREDLTLSVECRRGDGCSGYLGDARPDLTGVRPEGDNHRTRTLTHPSMMCIMMACCDSGTPVCGCSCMFATVYRWAAGSQLQQRLLCS